MSTWERLTIGGAQELSTTERAKVQTARELAAALAPYRAACARIRAARELAALLAQARAAYAANTQ